MSSPSASTLATSSVTVASAADGKLYKMVMQGDVGLLSVAKIKRYLQQATGLEPREQRLTFGGRLLLEHEQGSDFHLIDGAVITLSPMHTNAMSSGSIVQPTPLRPRGAQTPSIIQPSPLKAQQSAPPVATAQDTEWFVKELQKVREEERQRYEEEKKRHQEVTSKDLERVRLEEKCKLLEQEKRDAAEIHKKELDSVREQLARELTASRGLKEVIHRMEEDRVCDFESIKEERRFFEQEMQRKEREHQAADREMTQLVDRQAKELDQCRNENDELNRQLRELTATFELVMRKQREERPPPSSSMSPQRRPSSQVTLRRSLELLEHELRVPPLELDANHTCIITVDHGLNLICTFDPNTERLFLYTTLLNHLPSDSTVRYQLYEELLQGALLGREMAGGCVGISKTGANRLILMSTSLDLRYTTEEALKAIARPFIAAALKWIDVVQRLAMGFVPQSAPPPVARSGNERDGSARKSPSYSRSSPAPSNSDYR